MTTKLRIASGDITFDATVDPRTNAWTVELPDEEHAGTIAAALASIAADEFGGGYEPDPANRYAHAVIRAFPGSTIVSGLVRSAPPRRVPPHVIPINDA